MSQVIHSLPRTATSSQSIHSQSLLLSPSDPSSQTQGSQRSTASFNLRTPRTQTEDNIKADQRFSWLKNKMSFLVETMKGLRSDIISMQGLRGMASNGEKSSVSFKERPEKSREAILSEAREYVQNCLKEYKEELVASFQLEVHEVTRRWLASIKHDVKETQLEARNEFVDSLGKQLESLIDEKVTSRRLVAKRETSPSSERFRQNFAVPQEMCTKEERSRDKDPAPGTTSSSSVPGKKLESRPKSEPSGKSRKRKALEAMLKLTPIDSRFPVKVKRIKEETQYKENVQEMLRKMSSKSASGRRETDARHSVASILQTINGIEEKLSNG